MEYLKKNLSGSDHHRRPQLGPGRIFRLQSGCLPVWQHEHFVPHYLHAGRTFRSGCGLLRSHLLPYGRAFCKRNQQISPVLSLSEGENKFFRH